MKNQDGIATILAVLIASILMSIITVGMVTLMSSELRQAEDNENSVKAYYASETGIEEGELALINASLSAPNGAFGVSQNCDFTGGPVQKATSYSYIQNQVELSCLKISSTEKTIEDTVDADNAVQYDLSTVDARTIDFSWNTNPTGSAPFITPDITNPGPGSGWSAPPVVEVTAVSYAHTTATNIFPASNALNTVVLTPCYIGGGACGSANATIDGVQVVATASCMGVGQYRCHIQLRLPLNGGTNPRPFSNIIRIRPRFASASFSFQALDRNGNALDVPSNFATIDATARSGDSSRRVTEKFQIHAQPFPNLNEALFGTDSVCEKLSIVGATFSRNECVN